MSDREGILFLGTPQLAADCLKRLLEDGLPVKAVITQPDRPVGRKRIVTPSPVKQLALERGLAVHTPESFKTPETKALMEELNPKVAVVVAYGKIIPADILPIPESFINLHVSLLPQYRGAAPVQRALYDGQTVTGVSIQYLAARLDAGPIIADAPFTIAPSDTTESLWERCTAIGASLLTRVVAQLLEGPLPARPQDEGQATYAAKMAREDGFIDWSAPARTIHNHVRACNPWPGAVTWREGRELKIWGSALPGTQPAALAAPGTVLAEKKALYVACGDGYLQLTEVQPAGGARQNAQAFLSGLRGETLVFQPLPGAEG